MTVDSLLNRQSTILSIRRCDWSTAFMLLAVFVWVHGFNTTGLPKWTWYQLGLSNLTTTDHMPIQSIATIAGVTLLGSNIFSPYLFTLTFLELLEPCHEQLHFVLYVAWFASIAGNLTLFGSVSNVITVQKARQTLDFRLSFWKHLRFSFVMSLISGVCGLCLMYGILQISAKVTWFKYIMHIVVNIDWISGPEKNICIRNKTIQKYTNPARGILTFASKSWRPLLLWQCIGVSYLLLQSFRKVYYCIHTLKASADFSGTEQEREKEKEKEHGETIK